MVPILWKYLFYHYARVFALSIIGFIALLLVTRFKEIAQFAALSCSGTKTFWFTLFQLPLVLQIAIPISALIASLMLFQKLSRNSELTALRVSGLSLGTILIPIFYLALILSGIHWLFAAHLAPYCRKEAKVFLCNETSVNPLLLLQRQKLLKIKHTYLQMDVKEEGKFAEQFLLVAYNGRNRRLNLLSAERLMMDQKELVGQNVAVVSYLPSEESGPLDSLVIENQALMSMAAPLLSQALKKNRLRLEPSFLSLRMLRLSSARGGKVGRKALIEIFRRMSLALTPFTFTLLGALFAIDTGRVPSRKNLWIALVLAFLLLLSFFLGKELKTHLEWAVGAFFLPHLLLWVISFLRLRHLR